MDGGGPQEVPPLTGGYWGGESVFITDVVPERRWSHACAHTGTQNGRSGIKERVCMKM